MAAGKLISGAAKFIKKKLGALPSDNEVDVSRRDFLKKGTAAPAGGLASLGAAALATKSLRKLFAEGKFDKIISDINNKFDTSTANKSDDTIPLGQMTREMFSDDADYVNFIRESGLVDNISGYKNLDEFLDEFYEAGDDGSVIANGLQNYLDNQGSQFQKDVFTNEYDLWNYVKDEIKVPLLKNKILKIQPELIEDPELDKLTRQLVD